MIHPDIHRLQSILKRHPLPVRRLYRLSNTSPAPGQIWTLAKLTAGVRFSEVMVLAPSCGTKGLKMVDVAPLIHDATIVGPKDYILPESIFGHHAAVLLGMDFSLPISELGCCQGSPDAALVQDIMSHFVKVQDGSLALSDCHAPPFDDVRDFRYIFQERAAGQISNLQNYIYQWLDSLETQIEVPVIDVRQLFAHDAPEMLMAAAGAERPDRLKSIDIPFRINGKPACLEVRQSVKTAHRVLVIYGDSSHICAKVLDSTGSKLSDIVDSQARFVWSDSVGNTITIADNANAPIVVLKLR